MKTIIKNTKVIPGLVDLIAISKSDVVKIGEQQTESGKEIEIKQGLYIEMKSNAEIFTFQAALDSITSMIRIVNSNAGGYYNGRFVCFIAGNEVDNVITFIQMLNRRYIILYQDYQQNYWLFGDEHVGLEFQYVHRSEPRRGYEIIFQGHSINPAKPVMPFYILSIEKEPDHPDLRVLGAGIYPHNATAVIEAFAVDGTSAWQYAAFKEWKLVEGELSISSEINPQEITVNCNGVIKAIFEEAFDVKFHVTSDGVDIEGAEVTMAGKTKTTDSNGNVTFENVEQEDYSYTVTKEGYADESGNTGFINEDKTIEVELIGGHELIVTVKDNETNETIEDAVVKVYEYLGDKIDEGLTDASGVIVFEPLESSLYTITASKIGYESGSNDQDIQSNTSITITLVLSEKYRTYDGTNWRKYSSSEDDLRIYDDDSD